MSLADLLSLGLAAASGIIGLLGIVLAFFQARRANALARKIAEVQRATESPELSMAWPFGDEQTIYVFACAFPPQGFVRLPNYWQIANHGKRSARNVELIARMPAPLCLVGEESSVAFEANSRRLDARILSRGKMVTFSIGSQLVDPATSISVKNELVIPSKSSIETTVTATTADGVNVSLNTKVDFAYSIELVLLAEDREPLVSTFRFSVIDLNTMSIESFFEKENTRLALANRKRLDALKWWQRIGASRGNTSKVRILHIPETEVDPDTLLAPGSITVSEGAKLDDGYFVPAQGIYPDSLRPKPPQGPEQKPADKEPSADDQPKS